jgi:hypothetical protein
VTWVAAYPLSYAALGLLRSRHPRRFVRPLLGWLAVVAVGAAGLLLLRPWLVWVGAAYLALFAVHAGYARRNNERALANDLVFVLECASMVWVTWATAAGGSAWRPPAWSVTPARVVVLAAVCALVLAGSTLHVKSLIRERRDRRYATAARWFALASVAASAALATRWGLPAGWWLVVPFVVLAVRTEVVPRRSPRPAVIGLVELGCLVLVWLCAVLAAR